MNGERNFQSSNQENNYVKKNQVYFLIHKNNVEFLQKGLGLQVKLEIVQDQMIITSWVMSPIQILEEDIPKKWG